MTRNEAYKFILEHEQCPPGGCFTCPLSMDIEMNECESDYLGEGVTNLIKYVEIQMFHQQIDGILADD